MGDERLRVIGQELRRLRVAAGLSGSGLAARAGVPQPTVSRVEMGRRVADPDVVVRLVGALGLSVGEAEPLLASVAEAYAEPVRRVDAGVSFRPGASMELVAGARVVLAFGALVVPDLLRTAGYAADLGSEAGGVDALIGAEGRRFTFVVAEAVLRTWPGSGASMVGQFERLVEVAGRDGVRLGVVPGSVVLGRVRVPCHGFAVFDDAAVSVETLTRELTLTDAGELRAYGEAFAGLERVAVFGDGARELIEAARRDLADTLDAIH